MTRDTTPTRDEFERLLVNNPRVADIEAYLRRFNPIRVMRMEHMEIRHSAILGWLLDPQGSHGLGDGFCKAFLAEALRGREARQDALSALDIISEDFSTARVETEWRKIDLLIHLPRDSGDWVFVIENKVHSKQRRNQLQRYFGRVQSIFGKQTDVCGVFLTLDGEAPEDERFAPIQYGEVVLLLEHIAARHTLAADVNTFIAHYCNTLREVTHMDSETARMERLARKLYRENHKVIDFIRKHGAATKFMLAAESLFGDVEPDVGEDAEVDGYTYELGEIGKNYAGFLPESWREALYSGPNGKEVFWRMHDPDWWMTYPMVSWFEFKYTGKRKGAELLLHAEVGPLVDEDIEEDFFGRVHNAARDGLKISEVKKRKLGSRFFQENTVIIRDASNPADIEKACRSLLDQFRPEFDAIGEALEGAYKLGSTRPPDD